MVDLNPMRYRGYYYDSETGFYYLQSRFYDPITHRFINADALASTGQGFAGTNMFAYCNNKPVVFDDSKGNVPNYCTMYADSGVGGNDVAFPISVSVGVGCDAAVEKYMTTGLYQEDMRMYASEYSTKSTTYRVSIEKAGTYSPLTGFEQACQMTGKHAAYVAIGAICPQMGYIAGAAHLLVDSVVAINQYKRNRPNATPTRECDMYYVIMNETHYDFGTPYYRHTTITEDVKVLYIGIDQQTGNIYDFGDQKP